MSIYSDASFIISASGGYKEGDATPTAGKLYNLKPDGATYPAMDVTGGGNAVSQRSDGTWQINWPANTPRFSWNDGVPSILVESQRQNLITSPRSFSNAYWTKSGVKILLDENTITGSELNPNPNFTDTNSDGIADDFSSGRGTASILQEGENRIQTISNPANDSGVIFLVLTGLTIGKSYSYKIKVKKEGGLNGKIADITGSSSFETELISNTEYEYKYFYITAYTTRIYIGIYTASTATANTSKIYIDEISVKEVSGFACPFVDASNGNTNEGLKVVATANDATLKLTTPFTTVAASTYVNSLFIKRVAGTGVVSLIDVNDTDRAITLTPEWQRFEYAASAAGTTGQIGIKLATEGDEVMICHAQPELGASASSPIYGTEGSALTRLADTIQVALPAGVTKVELTNSSDVVTTDESPSDPYQIPVGSWKSIIMS